MRYGIGADFETLGVAVIVDFYELIAEAVSKLQTNDVETRKQLYGRARELLVRELRGQEPPLTVLDIFRQRIGLGNAIRRVEAEQLGPTQPTTAPNK